MAARRVAAAVAEPLVARSALDNRGRVVDAAVAAVVRRKLREIVLGGLALRGFALLLRVLLEVQVAARARRRCTRACVLQTQAFSVRRARLGTYVVRNLHLVNPARTARLRETGRLARLQTTGCVGARGTSAAGLAAGPCASYSSPYS